MKIKVLLFFSICIALVLCCAAEALNPPKRPPKIKLSNRLDIVIEGPWILYQDKTFQDDSGNPIAALILMAPNTAHTGYPHKRPMFESGDGYPVPLGISCVAFDQVCARAGSTKPLSSDDYPPGRLLDAVVAPGWSWHSGPFHQQDAYYLVLPMPDYYSNEGTWYMRYGSQFDPLGTTYYNNLQQPSIGVQLHYENGPTNVALFNCKEPDDTPGARHCPKQANDLLNTGTLRITMKNPNDSEVCDPHVRAAHPLMLKMLDNADLNLANKPARRNVNQAIAYVDPAVNDDGLGTPKYDNDDANNSSPYKCREKNKDPQDPTTRSPRMASMEMSEPQEEAGFGILNTFVQQLSEVVKELSDKDHSKDYSKLLFEQPIDKAVSDLDPKFPRISQLAALAKILSSSADEAKVLGLADFASREELLAKTLSDAADKDGKDCKASIMLAK